MKTKKLYFFSFFIPFIIMLIIFALKQIYPFGDRSFLHIDMYHQYFPFLVEFYHKIKNGESLFYSWNTGIGSNFLALYVYYLASPTNWLCLLFPKSLLMEFISYMVIIKTGLCGMSFAYYAKNHFQSTTPVIMLFSTFYALSGYMAAYNWNVMWLDCIVLAPVIIWGLELMVKRGKPFLYCLTLGFSILSNYYLSIMICIFLVLYFLVLLFEITPENQTADALACPGLRNIKNCYAKAIIRFAVYSLLAGGMAAILLLPELSALRFTEFSSIKFPSTVKTYFSTMDMLARHCFNVTVETGLDHWPNIYCGCAVFLLLPLYIMQKEIPVRQKLPRIILLAFMLISFSTNILNFLWHGLNYPDSLPARQSFLYIFLVLTVCLEALLHIKNYSGKEIMGLFLCITFFLILCEKLITDDSFTSACFLLTLIFLVCYAGIIHAYRLELYKPSTFFFLSLVLVILEAGTNTYITSVPTVSRTTYWSNYDSYKTLVKRTQENEKNDFFRFDKFSRRTQNDAMFVGFPSATCFSSTSNALVKDFYETYGMKSSRVYYCFDGATPVTAALLANRYMFYTIDIGENDVFSLADTEGKLYLYKNNYALPVGFMISSDMVSSSDYQYIAAHHTRTDTNVISANTNTDELLEELFSSADDVVESLHDAQAPDSLNPIERQNRLVNTLGIEGNVFNPVPVNNDDSIARIEVNETGHLYAYTRNTKIENIELHDGNKSKTFKSIKKKYILDLGYHQKGTVLTLSSSNDEPLNLTAYALNQTVLNDFINSLSEQPLQVDSFTDTFLEGHLLVKNAGELVLSVPYEPGWIVKVDGKECDIDLFEDMLISVFLTEGEHTITLQYYPKGFRPGILLSVISTGLLIMIVIYKRKKKSAMN